MSRDRSVALGRGQRRAALVAVAADLFSRKPYDEIFISDIAQAAAVAHGLLFYHFKDKRGLYLVVLKRVLDEIVDLHQPREGEVTREERLRGVLHRVIEYRRDHAQTPLAMMRHGGQDPEVDDLVEQARRAGADFLLGLLGVEGSPSSRLRAAIRGCMGFVDELTADWIAHECDLSVEEVVRLGYATIVAVLSSLVPVHCDMRTVVNELVPRPTMLII